MEVRTQLFVLFIAVIICASHVDGTTRTPKYQYFEDYLISITNANQVIKVDTVDRRVTTSRTRTSEDDIDEEDGVTRVETINPEVSDLEILAYFREVPREHWSCCMLGKLAGDKGFHCHAGFYRQRIQTRNPNRAHNARMLFSGPNPIRGWGRDLMHTFQRCVARHAAEFHKCCFAATIEHQERRRWQSYRGGESAPASTEERQHSRDTDG